MRMLSRFGGVPQSILETRRFLPAAFWVVATLLLSACNLVDLRDRDQDGVTLDHDCDDSDPSIGSRYRDVDGDGYGQSDASGGGWDAGCAEPDAPGYVSIGDDCADDDPGIYPGALETCDGVDSDCDGVADDGAARLYYADADGDGHGDSASTSLACPAPEGYVSTADDCDDNDPTIYPGAPERCDGRDHNCDPLDDAKGSDSYYIDRDGDGHGDRGDEPVELACRDDEGYALVNDDCNDKDPDIHPGALEVCDGTDQDCDSLIDEDLPTELYYPDDDADGHGRFDESGDPGGDSSDVITSCFGSIPGYSSLEDDCDDTDAEVYAGAAESCNGRDDDCDEQADNGLAFAAYHPDADGDNFGSMDPNTPRSACEQPSGYVADATDCDDMNSAVYPGGLETCNDRDDDCDGSIDEGLLDADWYLDGDGDEYGDSSISITGCSAPEGYSATGGDCDDADPDRYPGAFDLIEDGEDSNCNGIQDYLYRAAGAGPFYGDGGPATLAVITGPLHMAVDAQGNLYFADSVNRRIRKVDIYGNISTVAGNGTTTPSADNQQATDVGLNYASGVAVDPSGNLYIVEAGAHRVRKVSSSGLISTVAGTGTGGHSVSGPYLGDMYATKAQLNEPFAVAVDNRGSLYICEHYGRIERVDLSTGKIFTLAGNGTSGFSGDGGPATLASLNSPEDVAVDASGAVFIADAHNHRVRRVSAGIITTVAGNNSDGGFSGDGGQATGASLKTPQGVAIGSDGNLLIADTGNHRIRRVDGTGIISTVAGTGGTGFSGDDVAATSASLNGPYGLAVDNYGSLFISESSAGRIRRVGTDGIITTFAGLSTNTFWGDGGPATQAGFNYPRGIAVDDKGHLYIADTNNLRVRLVTPDGKVTTVAGNGTSGSSVDGGQATLAQFKSPYALAIDTDGSLLIADQGGNKILRVGTGGTISTVAGTGAEGFSGDGKASEETIWNPEGIAVDGKGNLFISDTLNNRIRRVGSDGRISTFAGSGVAEYSGDGGPATSAGLNHPGKIAYADGCLYIADTGNRRIRRVAADQTITTIAGNGVEGSGGDGKQATDAALANPLSVAVDGMGNVYIADRNSGNVRMVDLAGIIHTTIGTGAARLSGEGGPLSAADIAAPFDVNVDASGRLYIVSGDSATVEVIVP